ncbi:MAG: LysR family transcriptional regulator [Smithella sp.]|nr:LysR family transcriptional regulator [Chloroflexota bacterium]
MTIQQLIYVLEIKKHGSLRKAAKALFISQPSLSLAIKELEAELQIQIFTRTNKGVVPSREGIAFIERCKHIVSMFEDLKVQYKKEPHDYARLYVSSICNTYVREAFLKTSLLLEERMNVSLKFKTREVYEVIDDVINRQFDLGILLIPPSQKSHWCSQLFQMGLQYHSIGEIPIFFILNKNNPLATNKKINFEDLQHETYIYFGDEEIEPFNYISEYRLYDPTYFSHKKSIMLYDYEMVFELLSAMPLSFTSSHLPSKSIMDKYNLIAIKSEAIPTFELGYIMVETKTSGENMLAFIDTIKDNINNSLVI